MELASIIPDPSPWLDGVKEDVGGEDVAAFRDFIESLDLDDLEK